MPRWVVANEDQDEESSSEEEEQDEERENDAESEESDDESAHEENETALRDGEGPSNAQNDSLEPATKRQKISLQLGKSKLVCHVSRPSHHFHFSCPYVLQSDPYKNLCTQAIAKILVFVETVAEEHLAKHCIRGRSYCHNSDLNFS